MERNEPRHPFDKTAMHKNSKDRPPVSGPVREGKQVQKYLRQILNFNGFNDQHPASKEYGRLKENATQFKTNYPKEYDRLVKSFLSVSSNIDIDKDALINRDIGMCENLVNAIHRASEYNHMELAAQATKELHDYLAIRSANNDCEKDKIKQMKDLKARRHARAAELPIQHEIPKQEDAAKKCFGRERDFEISEIPFHMERGMEDIADEEEYSAPHRGEENKKGEFAIQREDTSSKEMIVKIPAKNYDELMNKIAIQRREIDELYTRLSGIASENLKDGKQADMNDLSDQNRPAKLCEMFSELYNEQWTSAFEELQAVGDEDKAVDVLLKIISDVFMFCKSESTKDLEYLAMVIFKAMGGDKSKNPKFTLNQLDLPDEQKQNSFIRQEKPLENNPNWLCANKHARQIRKDMVSLKLENIEKSYIQHQKILSQKYLDKKAMDNYVRRCIKLCWMMVIQTPPMHLVFAQNGDKFDTTLFEYNQEKGRIVKSCVWPALLRNEDGDLFSKGVANGCKKS